MTSPRKKPPLPGVRINHVILCLCLLLPFPVSAQRISSSAWAMIWGSDTGLYRRDRTGRTETLWTGGKVREIISLKRAGADKSAGEAGVNRNAPGGSGVALLTDQGIYVSDNLKDWEQRNRGLPGQVIKLYEDGKSSLVTTTREIKCLNSDPRNPDILVSAVKDAVYLSRDGGRNWENLGMPNYRSTGIKAVAVTSFAATGELTVFCSHAIYGVYYINPGRSGAKWTELSGGLEELETSGNPDEVSDFAVTLESSGEDEGGTVPVVYAAQSFRRRIYKLNWPLKTWELLWSDDSEFGMVDSLSVGRNRIRFVSDRGILELPRGPGNGPGTDLPARLPAAEAGLMRAIPANNRANCVLLWDNSGRPNPDMISLSELWIGESAAPAGESRAAKAAGKDGLYLPVNHAMDSTSLKPYLDIIGERKLNMVVIDMKDDYGRLRFTPKNTGLTNFGRVFWPVDIEEFLKIMKERGIYTVARIVVFKDPEAARRNDGKYAVWDGTGNKPWAGYYDTRRKKPPVPAEPEPESPLKTELLPADDPEYEILRTWYDEKWVDPYAEEIWDYNASVAKELTDRGFDEIQFDYIRFPTDGENLGDSRYRWKSAGMDMDSAILSFLRHVRSRVTAPISVDIYGANGWYRTGARTGQEVELLAPWVDVICPMYYPSHFEQDFLAQDPPELRPFRIYYQGTRRTSFIARGEVVVRPWAQAFYLNVAYDRKYYNTDYVRRQAEGVRAAGNGGITYWNNSGRYGDIPGAAEIKGINTAAGQSPAPAAYGGVRSSATGY